MQHHVNGKVPVWLADIRRANGDARHLVEAAFLTAIKTCASLDDADARWFRIHSSWPRFPADSWFAYTVDDEPPPPRFTPTPAELDRMLVCLSWGTSLDRQQWQIAHDTAEGYSVQATSYRLHMPVEVVSQCYDRAIDTVVGRALAA